MNKKELIAAMAEKSGMTKVDLSNAVDAIVEVISEALAAGDEVALFGLGKFVVRDRAARTGRNPQTGETILIAACKTPAFKAAKTLKDAVKNS